MYSFSLWQSDAVDVSRQFDTCGEGGYSSCLWDCGISQYYNSGFQQCVDCDTSCVMIMGILGVLPGGHATSVRISGV